MSGVGSEQLIFDPIRREHAGLFRCAANNGLPRPIERLFEIDVLCKYSPVVYNCSIAIVVCQPPAIAVEWTQKVSILT